MDNRQKVVELLSRQMSQAAAEAIASKCNDKIRIVEAVYFDTSGEDGKDIENVVQRVLPMFKEKRVRGNFQYLKGAGCWLMPPMQAPKETEVEKLQREIAELKAKLEAQSKAEPKANSAEARAIELEILQRTPKPTYPQKQPALPASNNRSIRRPAAPPPAESVEDDAPPF